MIVSEYQYNLFISLKRPRGKFQSDPEVIKLLFILNSDEHEIYPAYKC